MCHVVIVYNHVAHYINYYISNLHHIYIIKKIKTLPFKQMWVFCNEHTLKTHISSIKVIIAQTILYLLIALLSVVNKWAV